MKYVKHLFVSYGIAEKAHKLGFYYDCLAFYSSEQELKAVDTDRNFNVFREVAIPGIKAPTYQQIQDWLRESHNIEIQVKSWNKGNAANRSIIFMFSVQKIGAPSTFRLNDGLVSEKYYDALDMAIEDAFGLIKK